MHYKNAALAVAGLVAQQAAAQGWSGASPFSCPGNTNNHCSPQQSGGYNWSSLPSGQKVSSYGSNSFSGFSCSNSFGKRDLLTKRAFQDKCISGSLDDEPSMSCDSGDSFSIDTMDISSSHDTNIDCHYGMPDGSTCVESHSCSSGGAVFQNTQCGGAKSVTFKPGKGSPSGCSIGVHSIGFHCGSASSTVPVSPSTSSPVPSVPVSTAPASSVPVVSSVPGCHGPGCSSTPSSPSVSSVPGCHGPGCSSGASAPSSSAPAPPCYGGNCGSSAAPAPSCSGAGCSSAAPAPSSSAPAPGCHGPNCGGSSAAPIPSSSAPAPGCHGPNCGGSSSAPVPSSSAPAPGCYGGKCGSSGVPVPSGPAPSGPAPSGPAPSGPAPSGPAPGCHGPNCGASSSIPAAGSSSGIPSYGGSSSSPVAAGSSSSPASPPASSTPQPNCPDLLPRCLNTWMFMAGCNGNADSNCFCGNEAFIKNVMGCVSAWGTESEVSAAVSYLMGLCAAHVPSNPAIITGCPSTVTPQATVPPKSPAGPGGKTAPPAPCTTITYSSSVVVPATFTTGVSQGFTIPSSSFTTNLVTTVTVPQVHLTTSTVVVAGQTTTAAGLGAGTPPAASAYPTGASTAAAGATGTGFGTSFKSTPTASSSPIVPATGAGVKTGFSFAGLALGLVGMLAAL